MFIEVSIINHPFWAMYPYFLKHTYAFFGTFDPSWVGSGRINLHRVHNAQHSGCGRPEATKVKATNGKTMQNQFVLGGGNSNICSFLPRTPGEMLQFDGGIFFKWVGSTTNYCNLYQMDGSTFEFGGPGKVVSKKCLRGASFLSTQLWGNFLEQCHNDLNQWTCDFFGIARIDMQWLHHQCRPSCSRTASRNFDCFWICSTSKAWILHLTSLLDGNSLGHRLLKIDIGSIRDFL